MQVTLPKKHIFETPRFLQTDAYTVGSPLFQSPEATEKSTYYVVFRRTPHQFNADLYEKGDDRIIFAGLNRILERLFYNPITHAEIDSMKKFLATFRVTMKGLTNYPFPEALLRRVVDEFNGRPPIQILAMPEGSVVYPNEPVMLIRSLVKGFGELAAWFEAVLLQVYGVSEAITQGQHWLKWLRAKIRECDSTLDDATVDFKARIMLTDMGARAGFNPTESEDLGMAHLYSFPGTDTLSGAFQAFMDSGEQPVGNSVLALAHRNVQAFGTEDECYENMYNLAIDGELLSQVGDAYGFERAVTECQTPLAVRSAKEGRGIIIVSRPDSGEPLEQIKIVINSAISAGLFTTQVRDGKIWYYPTTQHFIEADGMTFSAMKEIINVLAEEGFAFYDWGLFGMGGQLRNNLKRDNLSAKYALCACGEDDRPVVKFSETIGKTTLPGAMKVVRDAEALATATTIRHFDEAGENAMVEFFNGLRLAKPFGPGQDDNFPIIKTRIDEQMATMPLTLRTQVNLGYPASAKILTLRRELLKQYAPDKVASDY